MESKTIIGAYVFLCGLFELIEATKMQGENYLIVFLRHDAMIQY